MFLLDTNVVSELRKGERTNSGVLAFFGRTPTHELYLPSIVIGELIRGMYRVGHRRDHAQAKALGTWIDAIVVRFAQRIVDFDAVAALKWGQMMVPDPLPERDGLTAATAVSRNWTVVTRNAQHFRGRCQWIDPFQ